MAELIRIHPDLHGPLEQRERSRRRGGGTTWRCDGCGKVSLWGPTWCWFGSLKDLEDEGSLSIRVACSDGCRSAARGA